MGRGVQVSLADRQAEYDAAHAALADLGVELIEQHARTGLVDDDWAERAELARRRFRRAESALEKARKREAAGATHHMAGWPRHYRGDRGIWERICPHGIGHPDPDQPLDNGRGVHGCDGCCVEASGE